MKLDEEGVSSGGEMPFQKNLIRRRWTTQNKSDMMPTLHYTLHITHDTKFLGRSVRFPCSFYSTYPFSFGIAYTCCFVFASWSNLGLVNLCVEATYTMWVRPSMNGLNGLSL